MDQDRIDAMFQFMSVQRNQLNDQITNLVGELAVKDKKIKELEDQLKPKDDVKED